MSYKNIKIIVCFLFCFISTASLYASDTATKKNKEKETTTGFMQEITEVRIHNGPDRTGKEVYEYRCKGCHARNTQGAPMPDDKFEWDMRLKQKGIKRMLKNSVDGFNNNLMPPKGGCRNCNTEEVYASVYYMLKRSGINVDKIKNSIKSK